MDILDGAIDKCRLLLDAARLSQAFQPNVDLENRIVLLKKKHDALLNRRELEVERWTSQNEEQDDAFEDHMDEVDILPSSGNTTKKYPFSALYLLGSTYRYNGPEMMKHMNIDDPELTTFDFSALRQVVVELDTFLKDLEDGCSVLGIVETFAGSIFPDSGMTIRFRKLPGTKYKRQAERLLHEEILLIRKHGYKVNTV